MKLYQVQGSYLDKTLLSPPRPFLAAPHSNITMRWVRFNFDLDRYLNRIVPRSKLHYLPGKVSWILGYRRDPAPQIGNVLVWWWAFIGAFCGILIIEAVFHTKKLQAEGAPIVIASLVKLILGCPGAP